MPSIHGRARLQLTKSLVRVSDALLDYAKARIGPVFVGEDRDEEMRLLAILTSSLWNNAEGALPYLSNALDRGVYANHPRASTLSEASWLNAREMWASWANEIALKVDLGELSAVGEVDEHHRIASANVEDSR